MGMFIVLPATNNTKQSDMNAFVRPIKVYPK